MRHNAVSTAWIVSGIKAGSVDKAALYIIGRHDMDFFFSQYMADDHIYIFLALK